MGSYSSVGIGKFNLLFLWFIGGISIGLRARTKFEDGGFRMRQAARKAAGPGLPCFNFRLQGLGKSVYVGVWKLAAVSQMGEVPKMWDPNIVP